MSIMNRLERPESAGIFEDLSPLEFTIQEQLTDKTLYNNKHNDELPYIIYFRVKEDGEYGIPVPNPSQIENYYKKYLETIIEDLFEDIFPFYLFDNNDFISISCSYEDKEMIRKELIKNKAVEGKIVHSIGKVKINQIDKDTVSLLDEDSLVSDFTEHSRFKEFIFRMSHIGFEYFKEDQFKYKNQKVEEMDEAAKRFYKIR